MTNTARGLFVVTLIVLVAGSMAANAQGVILQLSSEDRQMIDGKLGPIVDYALPSAPIGEATEYFPLRERTSTYKITSGHHAGKVQTLSLSRIPRPDGRFGWRLQLSASLAAFIDRTSAGDLIMPTVGDVREGVVVITTPANPFVLKGMVPGEARSYLQRVSVTARDDPADEEYSGYLNGTYTYLGTFQVTVPAGRFTAVLVRLKCHGKVGPAVTDDAAYYFFAPGRGVVAMISQEDATAFWIIHINSSAGRVLLSD